MVCYTFIVLLLLLLHYATDFKQVFISTEIAFSWRCLFSVRAFKQNNATYAARRMPHGTHTCAQHIIKQAHAISAMQVKISYDEKRVRKTRDAKIRRTAVATTANWRRHSCRRTVQCS